MVVVVGLVAVTTIFNATKACQKEDKKTPKDKFPSQRKRMKLVSMDNNIGHKLYLYFCYHGDDGAADHPLVYRFHGDDDPL